MSQSTKLFRRGKPHAKNLLVVNKGPGAIDIPREDSKWDLLEIYFMKNDIESITANPAAYDADYIVFETDRKMRKYAIIKAIFEQSDFWLNYDYFIFADDDVIPVGCTFNSIFKLFATTKCGIGQPALTQDSYYSHAITIQNSNFIYRNNNFAEVMCPIFTKEAVRRYLPFFDITSSAFGLDNYWSYHEWLNGTGTVVLDQTPIRHCRPVGGGIAYEGLSADEELTDFLKWNNIPLYAWSCFSGVDLNRKVPNEAEFLGKLLSGYDVKYMCRSDFRDYQKSETAIHFFMTQIAPVYGAKNNTKVLQHIAAIGMIDIMNRSNAELIRKEVEVQEAIRGSPTSMYSSKQYRATSRLRRKVKHFIDVCKEHGLLVALKRSVKFILRKLKIMRR
jgi:hypothetical protein